MQRRLGSDPSAMPVDGMLAQVWDKATKLGVFSEELEDRQPVLLLACCGFENKVSIRRVVTANRTGLALRFTGLFGKILPCSSPGPGSPSGIERKAFLRARFCGSSLCSSGYACKRIAVSAPTFACKQAPTRQASASVKMRRLNPVPLNRETRRLASLAGFALR